MAAPTLRGRAGFAGAAGWTAESARPPSRARGSGESRRLAPLLVVAVASLLVFCALAVQVAVADRGPLGWERGIAYALVSHWRTGALLGAMRLSWYAGGWEGVLLASAVVAIVLALRRAAGQLVFFGSAMAVLALTPLLKVAFHRTPPEEGIGDYSFPSGHALGTMALAASVLVLLARTRWRWPAVALAAVFVAAIGAAVVTSQGHWPSDVVAGWALAIAWVAAAECARRLVRGRRPRSGELTVRGGGGRKARPSGDFPVSRSGA